MGYKIDVRFQEAIAVSIDGLDSLVVGNGHLGR